MGATHTAGQAAAANRERYAGGGVVNSYLREPYHRLRLEIATTLLAESCGKQNHLPRVADLGSGSGEACALLSAGGLYTIACDADDAALRVARIHSQGAVRLDAGAPLPFRSGTLDGILAGELIEHLFDTRLLLAECFRVLRPGGILVLTTPNLATFQDRLRFLIGRSPRQINPYHEYLWLHIRPFTASSLRIALRSAGLVQTRLLSNYVVWYSKKSKIRLRWPARRWPALGGSLIAVAIRPDSDR